jgi:hypothetical protein
MSQVFVHAAEVEMRELTIFVSGGGDSFLEPGYGFAPPAQLDEVGADIVVCVAEGWIERNGLVALFNRGFVAMQHGVSPA